MSVVIKCNSTCYICKQKRVVPATQSGKSSAKFQLYNVHDASSMVDICLESSDEERARTNRRGGVGGGSNSMMTSIVTMISRCVEYVFEPIAVGRG